MSTRLKRSSYLALLSLFVVGFTHAAPPDSKSGNPSADGLVKEALHSEIYGENADRERLLGEARQVAPDYAPARWQSGEIRYHSQWLSAADAQQQAAKELPLVEYRKVRDNYPQAVDGQLSLANWCKRRGLLDQERAHLTCVLELNPNHAEARQRLGFRRVNGVWMLESELQQAQARGATAAKALAVWTPKLQELRDQMSFPRPFAQRKAAREKLAAITDPDAIPSLEVVFSADSEQTALTMLDALTAMSGDQAVLALARQAVLSPFEAVRTSAARRLKSKPEEIYVPALLSAMYTPAQSRTEIYAGPGNRLMYRHSFLREGRDAKELVVFETAFQRVAIVNGDASETLGRALGTIEATAADHESELARQNAESEQLNDRICAALSIAEDANVPHNPESWWQWWNAHNEVFVGDKAVNQQYQLQQVALVDQSTLPPPTDYGVPAASSSPPPVRFGSLRLTPGGYLAHGVWHLGPGERMPPILNMLALTRALVCDCLAAGTKVWTLNGPVAIETIKVGDLALSQNVETGELQFKPVLKTTIRPAGKLVKATIGDETLEASGGHLFWGDGEGWAKVRNLKSGEELHTLKGAASVSLTEEGSVAKTYNLVVADFNTYFVGDHKILSHDNTIKQRTTAVVPGLVTK